METVLCEEDSSSPHSTFPAKKRGGMLCCRPLIACSIQLAVMQVPLCTCIVR